MSATFLYPAHWPHQVWLFLALLAAILLTMCLITGVAWCVITVAGVVERRLQRKSASINAKSV